MGARPEAGNAISVCGAGTGGSGSLDIPADELRPVVVPGNAGGRAPARLPRQSAVVLELAFHRLDRVLVGCRHRSDLRARFQITHLGAQVRDAGGVAGIAHGEGYRVLQPVVPDTVRIVARHGEGVIAGT